MATEKLWDVMRRISAPYGSAGLASYAISAVDNALWDLKGKLLGRPVYELLGGPQKESIPCYASNTDLSYGTEHSIAWFLELGFKAVKLFLRQGPEAGIEGIRRERGAGRPHPRAGRPGRRADGRRLDVAERRVHRAPDGGAAPLPGQVAGGLPAARGHWTATPGCASACPAPPWPPASTGTTIHPFARAASQGLVDILQPDVAWVGGITASVRICHLAEAHGLTVIGHAGMNYPYGQHLALAMPAIPWGERSEGRRPARRAAGGDGRPAGHGPDHERRRPPDRRPRLRPGGHPGVAGE